MVEAGQKAAFDEVGIPVTGTMDDLLGKVDIVLDSSPGGVGRKNKELYQAKGVKAVFQGGEKNDIVDVFFHGYANYEKGVGKDYLKLTSCNTTGLIRAVDCLDREVGVERVIVTIVRRVADPGDTHRGLVDVAQVEPVPNHQAVDLMTIMPHIEATGLLVHVPTTHGHIINVIATTKGDISKERALELFDGAPAHPHRQDRRRLQQQRGALPLRPRPRQQARRHVRHRRLRRDHRQERARVHVRDQHPAGVGGDPRDRGRHPRRARACRPTGSRPWGSPTGTSGFSDLWPPFTQMKGLKPIVMERAEGAVVRDSDGKEYIDAFASLWTVNVGHGRQEIFDAINAQMQKLAIYHIFQIANGRPSNWPTRWRS